MELDVVDRLETNDVADYDDYKNLVGSHGLHNIPDLVRGDNERQLKRIIAEYKRLTG